MIYNVLSIAGSDPSGGAGIQADLKTFGALNAYGMAAITALTAQNTKGVRGFLAVEPTFVRDQIDAVFEDIRVDAVKVGMIATAAVARAVAEALRRHVVRNVVLDPVMVATSGDRLLEEDAIAVVRKELLPLARVITPNMPEAAVLIGRDAPGSVADMRQMLPALHRLGAPWVLLKGGHLHDEDSTDLLFDGTSVIELSARRIETRNTHGTGCTLSSAVAALLPKFDLPEAAVRAKAYLTGALGASEQLSAGAGHGPVHHFHALWPRDATG